ncbi:MAG TPA: hypothetical protein PK752_03800 [Accumulibacter sp.]|uniref:hypothetical protein n=1 Tax=Accumulibacter sp. TaxID=2053492 RepID=UPI002BE6F9E4|nr:hypothetical protein [Accumulibacter sp.]HRD87372.1 hypothetical protein [Accumulibacter sp.]
MAQINSIQLKRRLLLDQSEKVMRRRIESSDAPFLGLFGQEFVVSRDMRQAVAEEIRANPTSQGYLHHLEQHPALFSVWMVWHVMKGMGQDGHFSLYPHLQAALGMARELGQSEREPLWKSFRQAIVKLGLDPSPRTSGAHFMFNEYLRQVGVPLAWADDLARKMLAFARSAGLPDDDDPEGITSWQLALDAKLAAPFSQTARKGLALDTLGYYTRVFLRVRNADGHAMDPTHTLEKAMEGALVATDQGNDGIRRAALPYVLLHDGILGVILPGREEGEWSVTIDGAARRYRTSADDRFAPIDTALPREIEIRDHLGHQSSKIRLWEDSRPNRLLVFAANGRLKGQAQLEQPEALVLPPGNYTILSRFAPNGVEVEEVREEPRIVMCNVFLHPGSKHALANGPAQLILQAESQAFLNWQGKGRSTRDGTEFFPDDLRLTVEIPPDWLPFGGRDYVLSLTATALDARLEIPITVNEAGTVLVDIGAEVRQAGWTKGFVRLLAELRRPNEVRALQRSAVLYWHGLLSVSEGHLFKCEAPPVNFEPLISENVAVFGNVLKPVNGTSRMLRLVFNLGNRRRQVLTWTMPGVFVEVESILDSGQSQRVSRPLGSTEVVSIISAKHSAKQILVTANDAGELRLGDWSQQVDFARRPLKALSAAFLSQHITSTANTLSYLNWRSGTEIPLLNLVQPHSVSGISSEVKNGQFEVCLNMPEPLEELAITAQEMLSGERVAMTLLANRTEWTGQTFARARLMVLNDKRGDYQAHACFNLDRWPSGAWVFRFDGRLRGIWGHLENARRDVFGIGLAWDERRQARRPESFLAKLDALDDEQALVVLQRVQEALLPCYALESWNSLKWLADAWSRLVSRWKNRETEALTALADMAALRPPEDSAASWQLQMTVGAALPQLFALPAREYRRVNERPSSMLRALKAMATMATSYPSVFPHLIHHVASTGFSNVRAMERGASPEGFDIKKYAQALGQVDSYEYLFQLDDDGFLPGPGDYLGPLHLRHALRSLENRYNAGLSGNEIRRGQAIGLCQHARLKLPRLECTGTPSKLLGKAPFMNPWSTMGGTADEEVALTQQHLDGMAHLLASMAFACRLDARRPGTLNTWLARLNWIDIPLQGSLSYLLQVGEAIFAFYLLLWEVVLKADSGPGTVRVVKPANQATQSEQRRLRATR